MRWKCFKVEEIDEQGFGRQLPHATTHGNVHPCSDKIVNSLYNHEENAPRQNLAVITMSYYTTLKNYTKYDI
jgi:hypothetical protein